jgi:hypothetical protein
MNALRKIEVTTPAPVNLPERPIDITVTQIHQGIIKKGTVNSRLPLRVNGGTFFMPAPRMAYAAETLEAVAEVATRCAPWVRVIVGPRIWSWNHEDSDESAFARVRIIDGRLAHDHGGVAWSSMQKGDELIMMGSFAGTAKVTCCLHHEIWHAVEYHLASEDLNSFRLPSNAESLDLDFI